MTSNCERKNHNEKECLDVIIINVRCEIVSQMKSEWFSVGVYRGGEIAWLVVDARAPGNGPKPTWKEPRSRDLDRDRRETNQHLARPVTPHSSPLIRRCSYVSREE